MTRTATERATLPVDVITRQARTNFYYSFLFLPRPKRRAIESVYAFCRLMDDIADGDIVVDDARLELTRWRVEIAQCFQGAPATALGRTLQEIVRDFPIPRHCFEDLITGMEMDLDQRRYATFEELERYCYHVAGVTGLMCIEIFGYSGDSARAFALKLGTALQLVNILRDLKEDALRGRVYLPRDEMARFGYTEAELMASVYNENFVALMKFQCQRARAFFAAARQLLAAQDRSRMLAARIMAAIYYKLLERIEAANFNVFERRIAISKAEKAVIAIKTWMHS